MARSKVFRMAGWRIASRSRRAAGSSKTIRPEAGRSTSGSGPSRRPSAGLEDARAEPVDDAVARRPLGEQGVADRVGVEHVEAEARRGAAAARLLPAPIPPTSPTTGIGPLAHGPPGRGGV